MFIQVIDGHITDVDEFHQCLDQWVREQGPRAKGWLGTTAGVTDDGMAIAMVRFDSEPSARANSERPEQHAWWMETAKLFAGDVHFADCAKSYSFLAGGSDDAGFVQFMRGFTDHIGRLRELDDKVTPLMAQQRPDIIGGTVAQHGDGHFTAATYFTSEAQAREGERRELPPHLKSLMEEQMALIEGLTFLDLHQPWLYSRASR